MSSIYASDPDAAPDSEFRPAELAHLVPGNRGRLLDARRTPVIVTAVTPARGAFEIEIGAFEDAGARWELPLWEIERFQFPPTSELAPPAAVAELERARERFDRELRIDPDAAALERTNERLAGAQAAAADTLAAVIPRLDVDRCVDGRHGDPQLYALLDRFMTERGLAALDRDFTETFVSNPNSGELVKGHAIVLAELGLHPYRGKVVRDPALFSGQSSKSRRAEHLVARLGFTRALWRGLGYRQLTLYRGAALDGTFAARPSGSFVSATFSKAVAEAHFAGGQSTRT